MNWIKPEASAGVHVYRHFGLTLAVVISLLFGLLLPWLLEKNYSVLPWLISALFLFFAVVRPRSLALVYIPWMAGASILGAVNTRILLFFVFFFVFTPAAVILRLARRDVLDRHPLKKADTSCWKTASIQKPEHMENIY